MGVKFLGTSDEVTTCDCCGKSNLKSTVALSIDEGDAVYFGVTCAARALKVQVGDVRKGTALADREKARIEAEKRNAAWKVQQEPWMAFLRTHGKGPLPCDQIDSLGGYKAARAMFVAQQG